MKDINKITIPLSKTKITFLILGSIAFVIVGFLFTMNPEKYVTLMFRNEELIRIAGIASIGFFGLCGFYQAKKLFDKKPGLIIDKNGLTDNSSGVSAGLIKWEDILDIEILEVARQKIIKVLVSNPDEYIERQKSGFKRKLMKLNHNKYETPIQITANGLKCSFDELYNMINNNFRKNL